MQQEFATAFCAFTCVFAFSCCAYCTWIVHLNSRQCHCDGYKIAMEPEMTEQHAKSISYNLEDLATQVSVVFNIQRKLMLLVFYSVFDFL